MQELGFAGFDPKNKVTEEEFAAFKEQMLQALQA